MPRYNVAIYRPGDETPSQMHRLSAPTPAQAAEWATGTKLVCRGTRDRLRAQVPAGGGSR